MIDYIRVEGVTNMLDTKKIIIFGTGPNAEILMSVIPYEVTYIIDKYKNSGLFYDKPIYSPEHIMNENLTDIYIILTFAPSGLTYKKVADLLKEMNLIENIHFSSMYEVFPHDFPYEEIKPLSNYSPWREDHDFKLTFSKIRNNTLVDNYRCYELWALIEQVSKLTEGILLEVGVWKGGTGALIAKRAEVCGIQDKVYLCDTFEGVVKANPLLDVVYKGSEHSDTSEVLVQNFISNEMELSNVTILKGTFPDDTGDLVENKPVRFCHIDVDVYNSAKDIFEWVWNRMVVGGIIVFDDYGFMTCDGITQYVNNLKDNNELLFIHNINGHGIFIKIEV